MKADTLLRTAHLYEILVVSVCMNFIPPQKSLAQTGVLQTVVSGFSCSNVPVAVAVRNLSAYSPVPLNIVIDVIPQPVVTSSFQQSTVGDILKSLLTGLPDYATAPTNGTILLLPNGLIGDTKLPFMRKLNRFSVTYRSFVSPLTGVTNYACDFYESKSQEWNVGFNGMLRVSEATAKLGPIPRARTFEGMNLIEILTILSKEEHQSWSLSRVWPESVAQGNREFAERKLGPPPWPHPEAPCYIVFWRPLPSNGIENGWYGPENETPVSSRNGN